MRNFEILRQDVFYWENRLALQNGEDLALLFLMIIRIYLVSGLLLRIINLFFSSLLSRFRKILLI